MVTFLLGAGQAIFPLHDKSLYTFEWNDLGSYMVLSGFCAVDAAQYGRT